MLFIRSLIYFLGVIPLTVLYTCLGLLFIWLPFKLRFRLISGWARNNLRWLKLTCGLSFEVTGRENIPTGPAIIVSNHQSAWETLAMQQIFPPHVWVLKRELLWIPVFGWGLAALRPIAIDRKSIRQALKQVVEQGLDRLASGAWVVIFPEGTRLKPGETRRYAKSAGLLAEKSACDIVPVAHNAGCFWPKQGFLKYPGVIQLHIGPVISAQGKSAEELTEATQKWIQPRVDQLVEVNLTANRNLTDNSE